MFSAAAHGSGLHAKPSMRPQAGPALRDEVQDEVRRQLAIELPRLRAQLLAELRAELLDEGRSAAHAGEEAQLPGEVAESVDDGAARWARCIEIAGPPSVRNRSEIMAAYEGIKQDLYASLCQIQKRQNDADAGYKKMIPAKEPSIAYRIAYSTQHSI